MLIDLLVHGICAAPARVGSQWQAVAGRVKYVQLVSSTESFETLQRNGHVAVFEERVVEVAQVEAVTLGQARVAEKPQHLQLAYLISDGLARFRSEKGRLLTRGGQVHRHLARQHVRGGLDGE